MTVLFCHSCLRDFEGTVSYDPGTGQSDCEECTIKIKPLWAPGSPRSFDSEEDTSC